MATTMVYHVIHLDIRGTRKSLFYWWQAIVLGLALQNYTVETKELIQQKYCRSHT